MTEKYKYLRPRCPRCGSYRTRGHQEKFRHIDTNGKWAEEISLLTCERCDYDAHWLQFYKSPQQEAVQKLFTQGQLEGKKYILIRKEQKGEKLDSAQ